MTITHTDPIRTQSYVTASTLAFKLSGPLFKSAMGRRAILDPGDETYHAWWVIRQTAEKFLNRRSIALSEDDLKAFGAALGVAHVNAHDCLPSNTPSAQECPCATAQTILSLFKIFDEAQRKAEADAIA